MKKVKLFLSYTNARLETPYAQMENPSVHAAYEIMQKERDCIQAKIVVYDDAGMTCEEYTAWRNRDGSCKGKALTYCDL